MEEFCGIETLFLALLLDITIVPISVLSRLEFRSGSFSSSMCNVKPVFSNYCVSSVFYISASYGYIYEFSCGTLTYYSNGEMHS